MSFPGLPSSPAAYELFAVGRPVARLVWRAERGADVGWYLVTGSEPAVRLEVDPVIDELARDDRSDEHTWEVNAALAATLSTALALDAAERLLNRRPARATGRFRRLSGRARVEIYVTGIEAGALQLAVPELPLEAVSDVTVLAGELLPEALEAITRRIALLGGRVVAVLRGDAE